MNRIITLTLSFIFLCIPTISPQQRDIDKEFLDAVQKKDIPKINLLLSKGANINAQEDTNGYFALQNAINWPDLSLVKLLLDKGADVNLSDKLGDTALTDAARESGPEYAAIVKLLIERGADIHARHDAALFGAVNSQPEVVRLLLSKGAPVNAREADGDGNTVLMVAASGGSVEVVQILLTAGADIKATNNNGQTALMKAVALDHRYKPADRLPMIELLISKGSDVNEVDKYGKTPLLHSVVQYMSEAGGIISHPEVVQLLLDRGANVQASDEGGDTALIVTAGVWQSSIEIVRLLLAKGIDINHQNKKGTTALMVATEKGKSELVGLLLEKGADLNLKDAEGATALDYAIGNGQTEIAKSLFAKAAKSKNNYKNEAEMLVAVTNFALLSAATSNKLAEAKTQLAMGADINTRNRMGETALMLSIEYSYGRDELPVFLVEKGADLNAVDINGNTALMIATERNNSDAAVMLLAHKAAVFPRNKDGRTVLHIAAAGLHKKVVEALLTSKPEVTASSAGVDLRGVEVNGRDGSGRTPLMLAADNEGFVPDEVMELLLSHGAQIDAQDPQGNTSLMLSAKAGNMSGVEFLLAKGAAVNLKNNAGETALKFARRIHDNDRVSSAKLVEERVVAMLLKAGAKE